MRKPLFVLLLVFLSGCAKNSFETALDQVDEGQMKSSNKPYCEVDPTDYILYPKILSYDITSTKGGNFGFNLLKGILKAFDLKFKIETAELETAVSIYSPMKYDSSLPAEKNSALVIGDKTVSGSDGEVSGEIDIAQFFVDGNYYWKTSFSRLTKKGLQASYAQALEQLNANPSRWKTKVADVVQNYAIIPVGLSAGLRENDEFVFYNVEYSWNGEPCTDYLTPVPTTKDPIAKGKVIRAEDNAAALEITVLNPNEKIDIGTQVEILNLPKANKKDQRSLLRSVKVIDMLETPVPVKGTSNSVDLSSYANIQFRALLREHGFYQR